MSIKLLLSIILPLSSTQESQVGLGYSFRLREPLDRGFTLFGTQGESPLLNVRRHPRVEVGSIRISSPPSLVDSGEIFIEVDLAMESQVHLA